MSPDENPDKSPIDAAVDQALDAFVYAPIGLVFEGPALFPTLVEKGRNQVEVARMMGKMAVQMGQSEAEKRVASAEGPLRDVLVAMGLVPAPTSPPQEAQPEPSVATTETTTTSPPSRPAGDDPTAGKAAAEKQAATRKKPGAKKKAGAKKAGAKKKAASRKRSPATKQAAAPRPAPAVATLGIPDYDSLSASQVVKRLRGMETSDLEAVMAYEAATRARKTILNRIIQIQKG